VELYTKQLVNLLSLVSDLSEPASFCRAEAMLVHVSAVFSRYSLTETLALLLELAVIDLSLCHFI